MNTDMRKLMNLFEDEEKWISNIEFMEQFIEEKHHDFWIDLSDRIDIRYYRRALHKMQDAFQKVIKPSMKPAWITDIQIKKDAPYLWSSVYWKIKTVEDDPDEY